MYKITYRTLDGRIQDITVNAHSESDAMMQFNARYNGRIITVNPL